MTRDFTRNPFATDAGAGAATRLRHARAALLVALVAMALLAPPAAAGVAELPLPETMRQPNAIEADADGNVWVTLDGSWSVARIDTRTGEAKTFALASARTSARDALYGLAFAPDGSVWTASQQQVHRVDPTTGNATVFDLPAKTDLSGDLWIADDGTVWAALVTADRFVALDPANGSMRELAMPAERFGPLEFEAAGERGVFFTATYADTYAMFDPTTEQVTAGPADVVSAPTGIAFDGTDLWIGEHGGNSLVRVNVDTGESEKLPTAPSPYYPITGPSGVVVDDEGAVWFAIHFADRIARFDAATRTLVEYELPSAPGTNTQRVALAPDGKVWFAEWTGNRVGYATYGGEVPSVSVPDQVRVRAGESVTFDVGGAAGDVVIGAHDPTITGEVKAGKATLTVSDKVPPGTYNLVVSEKRDGGKTYVGQFMTLAVDASDAKTAGGDAKRGTPAPGPAAAFVVVSLAALAFRRRCAA